MERILGIAVVLGLVGALSVMAQEVKPGKVEVIDLGKGIELEMVLIQEGKFKMGSPESEMFRSNNETRHEVTITKPFYMGKYEVTQNQYIAVMGKNPSDITGANLPVMDVSWEDCQDFIKKLNAKTNGGFRLPTESEWEYACRAGTSTAFSFGNNLTPKDANWMLSNPPAVLGKPEAVGRYKSNAFGLYDMHGNVWEWCEDWYGGYPFVAVTDPRGPATGKQRVLRGSAFSDIYAQLSARSSFRNSASPSNRFSDYGFRLARTIDSKVKKEVEEAKVKKEAEEAKAKEVQKKEAMSLQEKVEEKEDLGKGIELDLILIPAGRFMMGDSGDRLQVTLTKPFYMAKYEVTQEQWEAVMADNPSDTKAAKLPVTHVSWEDCQEFIKRLNAKTNGGYRLPTEAEWEYSCRAGTTTAYSFGNGLTKSDANIDSGSIKAVGGYKPNAFGLNDLHGNVREFVEDWYAEYPKGAVTDPKGPTEGKYRVLRGGSVDRGVLSARSFDRLLSSPSNRFSDYGFRLARTIDSKAKKEEEAKAKKEEEAKAKETQKKAAMSLQKKVEEKEDLGKGIELEMVLVPEGKFKMGSPESEKGRSNNESQHEVTLTKPYYLGKYEVTQEQWEAVMGNNPSTRTKGAKLPVTDVSWEDCQEFIKKLNAKTNGGYRLPTEAEWEYACRAGTSTAYSFGNIMRPNDANYYDSKIDRPVAVGSYKPNAFGLYDMHGNVWEWCEDWIADYPAGAVRDPKGPAMGEDRVLRGGSFGNGDSRARSSSRDLSTPSSRSGVTGFRLARTP